MQIVATPKLVPCKWVDWRSTLLRAGWVIDGFDVNDTLLSRRKMALVPRDLWEPAVQSRFNRLVDRTLFLQRWTEACGFGEEPVFYLGFPSTGWDIPWELLIQKIATEHERERICFVRTTEKTKVITGATRFSHRLKVLLVRGAADSPEVDNVDPGPEIQAVIEAWHRTPKAIRDVTQEPILVDANTITLPYEIRAEKPDILWFIGHGLSRPRTRLLFADKNWVRADDLANMITDAGHVPSLAVFSACDTACRPFGGRSAGTPDLYHALTSVGVRSIIAMQSPITASSAGVFADSLIQGLAQGLSAERAVAKCRKRLMETNLSSAHKLDWAAPVVWSSWSQRGQVIWNAPAKEKVQLQLLGERTIRDGNQQLPKGLVSERPSSQDAIDQAQSWIRSHRVWIQAEGNSLDEYVRWLNILSLIHNISDRAVFAVDLNLQDDLLFGLKEWAETLRCHVLPEEFTIEAMEVLDRLSRRPATAWCEVCGMEGIVIALAHPPEPIDLADGFWQAVRKRSLSEPTVIFSYCPLPGELANDGWCADNLMGSIVARELVQSAVVEEPRIARAMAFLNMPVRESFLRLGAGPGRSEVTYSDWKKRESAVVNTTLGPQLNSTASREILSEITADQEIQAHADCVEIISRCTRDDESIQLALIDHLVGSLNETEAILEVARLSEWYLAEVRPHSVVRLLNKVPFRTKITMNTRLIAAWACLQTGDTDGAQYWLDRCIVHESSKQAWKHGLSAELLKSAGGKTQRDEALLEIDAAIDLYTKAVKNSAGRIDTRRYLWTCEQDKARILHFLFDVPNAASKEYERILSEMINYGAHDLEIAVVMRNQAECLRSISEGIGSDEWIAAKDLIEDAETRAARFEYSFALPEILYEKAKFAEELADEGGARLALERSQAAARKAGYFMLWSIVKNRLMWRHSSGFDPAAWAQIENELDSFPHHGWAVRTLIMGRIAASKQYESSGELSSAMSQLGANLNTIRNNPAFEIGSDRRRIAITYAGLQELAELAGITIPYWEQFLHEFSWATEWLVTEGITDSTILWRKEAGNGNR
jgi:hypothetical protein